MKDILKAAKQHFDKVEIFRLTGNSTEVEFEHNSLKKIDTSEHYGLALRGVKNGRIAFSTSTKPDDAEGIIDTALNVTDYSPECGFDFADGSEKPLDAPAIYSKRTAEIGVEEMVEAGQKIIGKIQAYDRNIQGFVGLGIGSSEVSLVNSEGFKNAYRKNGAGFACGGRLIEGQNILYVYESLSGVEYDFDFEAAVDKVIEDFSIARKNVEFSGGETPVILTPNAVTDLLLPIMACCNGKAVAKGISPWKDRLGEAMFDRRLTVYNDGLLPNAVATAFFDDEGVAAQKTALIENGVLKNFVLDLESGAAMGMRSTGSGMRNRRFGSKDASAPPTPSMSSVVMEAGERGVDEMMEEMGEGLLIDRLMGTMMGNLYGGVVSGNIMLGYKVAGGRRVGRIKDAMFSVNAFEVLKDGLVCLSRERKMLGKFLLPHVWLKSAAITGGDAPQQIGK